MSSVDLDDALTPENVRVLQVLSAALGAGVLTFALVVLLLSTSTDAAASPADVELTRVMSGAHVALALMLYAAALFVYRALVGRARQASTADALTQGIRTAEVARLALVEGAALFGLVVCLLGVLNGALQAAPVYWFNLFSTVVMLAVVALSFPTRDRLEAVYGGA